jgi:histidinol-phosphate aminotransferase
LAALDDVEHVERSLEANREGIDYLEKQFSRLGLEFVPSQANFILVRVGRGQQVFQQLLKGGVIVRPTGGYRFPEHVRVTVGTVEENKKFIGALERIISTR